VMAGLSRGARGRGGGNLSGILTCYAALVLSLCIGVGVPTAQANTHLPDLSTKQYKQAAAYYNNSRGFYQKTLSRSDWQNCIVLFQKAYQRDTSHPEIGPKSLYMMAKIYGKAYKQFGMNEDLRVSAEYYENLIFTFPDHALAGDAMVGMGRIVLKDKIVTRQHLFTKGLALYAKNEIGGATSDVGGGAAGFLLSRLHEHARERENGSQKEVSSATILKDDSQDLAHLAHINRPVRFWSSDDYTRVVIETSAPVRFEDHLLKAHGNKPRRLYIDLFDCRIPRTYQNPALIQDGLLKGSRGAQFNPTTSRVVMDLETISQYKIFSLQEPYRVVIDITGKKPEQLIQTRQPQDKDYTLAEQFGLGIKTIVVDAGHGGKDPGALGHGGLREKDVVLKVARKVTEKLSKSGYTVIQTRENDVFLPLEERTAIANTKKADLFVSIHVNATLNRQARGIETYYLSLASTPEERQSAALENAVSTKQLGELESILKDIMKNSKIKESRKFAGTMQDSLILGMQKRYGNVESRGLRKAPFFVLIGAQMPSILVELGFLSNRDEEQRLRSSGYLDGLASEIVMGIDQYAMSLQ
jgi:N-acetylmuramoyl-L-alanine amidase